jgi:acyl-CoA reductase-like NAD-dependent aldehyde dehydrogenase
MRGNARNFPAASAYRSIAPAIVARAIFNLLFPALAPLLLLALTFCLPDLPISPMDSILLLAPPA